MTPSPDEQIQALSRRCERILIEQDLRAKLKKSAETGKPLRIKLGMDPTAPDVTLGHAVPLKVVRQFQDWGHKAVLIIGDYTARVGDPTGRNQTRKVLAGEEIDANAKTYVAQVGKILLTDPDHLEVRYNGEWLGKMGLVDIIKLAVAQERGAGADARGLRQALCRGRRHPPARDPLPAAARVGQRDDRRRRGDGRQRPAVQQPGRPRVPEGGGQGGAGGDRHAAAGRHRRREEDVASRWATTSASPTRPAGRTGCSAR